MIKIVPDGLPECIITETELLTFLRVGQALAETVAEAEDTAVMVGVSNQGGVMLKRMGTNGITVLAFSETEVWKQARKIENSINRICEIAENG